MFIIKESTGEHGGDDDDGEHGCDSEHGSDGDGCNDCDGGGDVDLVSVRILNLTTREHGVGCL